MVIKDSIDKNHLLEKWMGLVKEAMESNKTKEDFYKIFEKGKRETRRKY